MPIPLPPPARINSTSYPDVTAFPLGIDRLNGEENPVFLERVLRAVSRRRGADYEGLLEEISLRSKLILGRDKPREKEVVPCPFLGFFERSLEARHTNSVHFFYVIDFIEACFLAFRHISGGNDGSAPK